MALTAGDCTPLLRADNSQNLTIDAANFPANTWSGTYNVSKTVNAGNLTLINYSGTFSGAAFEQDPYNRIAWQASGIMPVEDLQITCQSTTGAVSLSWSYASAFSRFKIYAASSPQGTFTEIGTTTTTSWNGTVSGDRRFYQVRAILD
jgi:hypothetical protein